MYGYGVGEGSRQAGHSSTLLAGRVAAGLAVGSGSVEDIRNGWRLTAGFDFYQVECLGFSSFGRDCLASAL
jgi:hypothetical protein